MVTKLYVQRKDNKLLSNGAGNSLDTEEQGAPIADRMRLEMSSGDNEAELITKDPLPYLTLLFPLLIVYISNQWSRSSLYYLVDFSDAATSEYSMNVALNFNQAQYGLLASVAFTALFAIASLLAGSLADKYDRKVLTVCSCLAWSLATLYTGTVASGYNDVLIARVFMGLACAFSTPAAYTFIADSFPKDKASFASSLLGSGVYLGGALSSLSILLDKEFGWQGALQIIAVFGLVSATASFLLLPDDSKEKGVEDNSAGTLTLEDNNSVQKDISSSSSPASTSLLSDAKEIISTERIQWLFFASFVRFCSGLCIGVWSAPYFRLAFPDDSSSYAVVNAFIVSICGVSSGLLGGTLADLAGAKSVENSYGDENAGRLFIPIVGSLLAVPAWWFCLNADSFQGAMIWLAIEYLVAECWFGPVVAVLQSNAGSKGGTAQGMFTLAGALGNFAPAGLGLLYGTLNEGTDDAQVLSSLLGYGVCLGYFTSAIGFALSAQAGNSGGNPQYDVDISKNE